MAKKKGLFSRLIEGPERTEDYARKTLPKSRWSLWWDLFTTNTGKLVKINLLMLLFLFPIFLLLFFRFYYIQLQGINPTFSLNLGIGYPAVAPDSLVGEAERIVYNTDVLVVIILFVLSFYVSIGLAGGFYVIRNLVWTEGVFVASDFWRGVKKNYWAVLKNTLLFVVFFGINILAVDLCDFNIAKSNIVWLFTTLKIISIIVLCVVAITYLFSLTISVTYKHNFMGIIFNSFILTIGLIPVNAVFMVIAIAPFFMFLFDMSSILFSLGLVLVVLLGISIFTMVWTNYSHWVFDKFVNDNVKGAKKYRGIYKNDAQTQPETFVYKKNIFTDAPIKPITDTEIEIATLPESYSRADLIRLEESKRLMAEDSERYALEHKDDGNDKEAVDKFMSEDKKDE